MLSCFVLFQNCGQTPFGNVGLGSATIDQSSSSEDDSGKNSVTVPYALLSSEQIFKSMASVTGTQPTTAITNEYNSRQSVLGSGFDLKLVTSPMLVSIANLASTFCNETLSREIAQPANARRLFKQIDFTRGPASLNDSEFVSTLDHLGQAFWGRGLNDHERAIITEAKSEYMAALTGNEPNQTAATRNLMLFTCTGMLSSFETISF